MQFSRFGSKFTRYAGITQLMDDLNQGLRTEGMIMLGGGNPAPIGPMLDYFQEISADMLSQGSLLAAMANYDGPQGNNVFIQALAKLLQQQFGWPITEKNISLTNGSQSAFFALFNLLAGKQTDGSMKQVLLPMAPEYIGYSDAGLDDDLFVAYKPQIQLLEVGLFKYHVDFEKLQIDERIGAICVSRPTNPTGNVLSDAEIVKLDSLARQHKIPLIIDNAYGTPFPNIIFEEVTPFWNDNTVLCMSLSKLGLPGLRCGIVIANETITQALTNISGIVNLSPGSVGPAIAHHMIARDDLLRVSQSIIKPYYQQKAQLAVTLLQSQIKVPGFRIHKPQGAIFLWLWFDNLPISTMALYERLKAKGVLVVPGEYFFFGMDDDNWPHRQQCLRMNYAQDETLLRKGIQAIADEVALVWQEAGR